MNDSDFIDPRPLEEPNSRSWHDSSVADEYGDGLESGPPIGLGRVIVVIVVLHVIAVAGVVGFRQLSQSPDLPTETVVEQTTPQEQTPTDEEEGIVYLVKAGDTLPSIARYFEASVAQIKSVNRLKSGDNLYVGQRLIIPQDFAKSSPEPAMPPASKGEEIAQGKEMDQGPLIAEVYEEEPLPSPAPTPKLEEKIQEPKQEPIRAKPIVIVEENVMEEEQPVVRDREETAMIVTPQPQPEPEPTPQVIPEPQPARSPEPSTIPGEEPSEPVLAQVVPMDREDVPPQRKKPVLMDVEPQPPAYDEDASMRAIPRAIPFDPRNPPRPTSRSGEVRVYQVKPGDTFYGIAQRFGVSTGALMKANGLKDPRQLRAGDVIRIP